MILLYPRIWVPHHNTIHLLILDHLWRLIKCILFYPTTSVKSIQLNLINSSSFKTKSSIPKTFSQSLEFPIIVLSLDNLNSAITGTFWPVPSTSCQPSLTVFILDQNIYSTYILPTTHYIKSNILLANLMHQHNIMYIYFRISMYRKGRLGMTTFFLFNTIFFFFWKMITIYFSETHDYYKYL